MPRTPATHSAVAATAYAAAASAETAPTLDTRSRILRAALRLFRQHGYHGVGINDILAMAQAPKGSMYHHFPGGKEEIGAAVVAQISQGVLDLIKAQPSTLLPHQVVARVGSTLTETVVRTRHELCALFSGFVAEKASAPRLAQAVDAAYAHIAELLQARLRAAGFSTAQSRDRALLVVMLLEGGSLVAAARGNVAPLKLAVSQAVALCRAELA
jgi:TetR/AcrR family transcriptional regulator, lmrAB and yxaGH operons repressor